MTFWKVEVESYILTSSFLLYKWLSRKLKWSHISCSVPWGHNWSNYIPVVILELQNAETRPSFLSKRSLALSYVIILEPRQKCYTVGHDSMHRCTGISYYGVVLQIKFTPKPEIIGRRNSRLKTFAGIDSTCVSVLPGTSSANYFRLRSITPRISFFSP